MSTPNLNVEEFSRVLDQPAEGPCQRLLTRHSYLLTGAFNPGLCLPKFRLGSEYETDFLILEVNSLGLHVTLIELEPPTSKPFNKNGTFSRRLNQAVNQIYDWMAWIDKNRSYFKESLRTHSRRYISERLLTLSSINAKVIIGRRHHLNDRFNSKRQALFKKSCIEITNYDRLLDAASEHCARSVAKQRNAQQLGRLGRSKFTDIRMAVAQSDFVSLRTLAYLSQDQEVEVRSRVASNPRTPPGLLSKLASGRERAVKESVLRNPSCPEAVLTSATSQGDHLLRRLAAGNPRLSTESQGILARDPEPDVRRALAQNPSLDGAVAVELVKDDDKHVRFALYRKQDLPEHVLVSRLPNEPSWIRAEIAAHPSLSNSAILERLANERAAVVRAGVARNPNISQTIHDRLLRDRHPKVKSATKSSRRECP